MQNTQGPIDSWITSAVVRSNTTHSLKRLYQLQADFLFNQYEPSKVFAKDAGTPFIQRLDQWLANFGDSAHQWNAFYSLRYFFFVGNLETEEMYRCAVQHNLYRWLVDQANIDIFSPTLDEELTKETEACWPCPVTDSLRINSLLHRTGLAGQDLRPDWYSLKALGDRKAIADYANEQGLRYLVLFEDFVGSGVQCERTVKFALSVFKGPVFLAPLIVCHPGDKKLRKLMAASGGQLHYSPVIVLTEDCLVGKNCSPHEPQSFAKLRLTMEHGYNLYAKTGKSLNGKAYGFSEVGCLYSSYSNCPNNTPPIFHAQSETWSNPLFPRKRRI